MNVCPIRIVGNNLFRGPYYSKGRGPLHAGTHHPELNAHQVGNIHS